MARLRSLPSFFIGLVTAGAAAAQADWEKVPGLASDIGAGGKAVWIVGRDAHPGGFGIYTWAKRTWQPVDGAAVRVDVGPDGTPWIVNDKGAIYARRGNRWQRIPGAARDIGVGNDGSVWVIGANRVAGGYGIYRRVGGRWDSVPGGGVRIDVGPRGMPWVVNDAGHIYRLANGRWQRMPGLARDIAVGARGNVWIVGAEKAAGGYEIFRYVERRDAWLKLDGAAVAISAFPLQPVIVNVHGEIFRAKRGGIALRDEGIRSGGAAGGSSAGNDVTDRDALASGACSTDVADLRKRCASLTCEDGRWRKGRFGSRVECVLHCRKDAKARADRCRRRASGDTKDTKDAKDAKDARRRERRPRRPVFGSVTRVRVCTGADQPVHVAIAAPKSARLYTVSGYYVVPARGCVEVPGGAAKQAHYFYAFTGDRRYFWPRSQEGASGFCVADEPFSRTNRTPATGKRACPSGYSLRQFWPKDVTDDSVSVIFRK